MRNNMLMKSRCMATSNSISPNRIRGEKKGSNRLVPELDIDDETDDFQDERSPSGRAIGIEIDEYELDELALVN